MPVKFESSVMQVGNSLRITIPQEISKYLNLEKGDIVELWASNHSILVEKKKLVFDAVWGFQEEILGMRKNLGKNIIAHTSQPLGKPLHKYLGRLSITRNNFVLEGKDADTKQEVTFPFSLQDLTDIYLGWDDTLRRFKDSRAWIRPLRITFTDEMGSKILYLYVKNPDSAIFGEENQKIYGILQRQ